MLYHAAAAALGAGAAAPTAVSMVQGNHHYVAYDYSM